MNAPRPPKQAPAPQKPPAGPAAGKPVVLAAGPAGAPAARSGMQSGARIRIRPAARPSRLRRRHVAVILSFLLLVAAPLAVTGWYLWGRAVDQYSSTVAFSVRQEEAGSAISSLLGPLGLSSSSTSDTDILYEFVQSQELVARIDEKLGLRALWSKADPRVDPVFSYHAPGTIEDLQAYWLRMVKIYYDSGTKLIELRVLAFTPEDARAIAEEIYAESTQMINMLSDVAREDTVRYAREDLEQTVEKLKTAREAMTQFRNRTQIVDPTVDLQGQAGLLNTLNQQLAAALIEVDLLKQTTRASDPRISQAERKISVIEARIEDEKRKLGIGDGGVEAEAFATLVGEYERLLVDREFAEQTYTAALAAYDSAQAEARRQSRYLAAHIRPTLAERAEYPKRLTLIGLIGVFLLLIWAILVLVFYSLRDRR